VSGSVRALRLGLVRTHAASLDHEDPLHAWVLREQLAETCLRLSRVSKSPRKRPCSLSTTWYIARIIDERAPGRRLLKVAPELPKPDVRPQLRELLAWYDDVLGRIAAGALVAPGVAERVGEEREFTARYLELLDAGEESSQATE
jgi:hypothetical protein